jgi:putative redox protein
MNVQIRWTPPKRFDGTSPSGASLVLDARPESGGTGAGPSPMEAVLMALAGCTGVDVVDILQKMRAPLGGLAITVAAERGAEHPRVFTKIHLQYAVWGVGLERDEVERAVSLSQEKYCSVSAMLRRSAELTYEIALSKEAPTPGGAEASG